jgi:hypothetical protein
MTCTLASTSPSIIDGFSYSLHATAVNSPLPEALKIDRSLVEELLSSLALSGSSVVRTLRAKPWPALGQCPKSAPARLRNAPAGFLNESDREKSGRKREQNVAIRLSVK